MDLRVLLVIATVLGIAVSVWEFVETAKARRAAKAGLPLAQVRRDWAAVMVTGANIVGFGAIGIICLSILSTPGEASMVVCPIVVLVPMGLLARKPAHRYWLRMSERVIPG